MIAAEAGTYYLHLRLAAPAEITVGRLGAFFFAAGHYIYCGSARGPGGLRARLERHIGGAGRLHWHIDWLRRAAEVVGWGYVSSGSALECDWSQAIALLPGACLPAPGFGASDCRRGCPAHLIMFPDDPKLENRVKWGNVNVWRII